MTLSRGGPVRVFALATHPIQYHAPWFRALSSRAEIDLEVGFLEIPDAQSQGRGFGIAFEWDTPIREGYHWDVLPTRRLRSGGFLGFMLRDPVGELRRRRPEIVLLTGWQSCALVQALLAARRLGIPVVMRGESNVLRARKAIVRRAHAALFRLVDAFLTIGAANSALYSDAGVDSRRMFRAPYFVDNAFFADRAARLRDTRDLVRSEFGIPADATCFLFAGKFEAKKRPADLVAAAAQLAARAPDAHVHLLMVGAGELGPTLKSAAAESGVGVTFTGFLNQGEIARAYVAADSLVLPSDANETWGLVVNEAMACGLPAIVSDEVGCGPDLVEHGVTGLRYPCANLAALSDCLESMLRDASARERMGAAARDRVLGQYTVARSTEAVVQACLSLARSTANTGARTA